MIKELNNLTLNNDDIGRVEHWDFSRANTSEENRIYAISLIASVCYHNPKAINSDSLYNRLLAESMGLPSSSFEFCNVLFTKHQVYEMKLNTDVPILNIEKYGRWVEDITTVDGKEHIVQYLLTNYRAVVYDCEAHRIDKKWMTHYNTELECDIIKRNTNTFKFTIDLATRAQMIRHRASAQELSRRYVSGKKLPFNYYISDNIRNIRVDVPVVNIEGEEVNLCLNIDDIIYLSEKLYYKLLDSKVLPQDARRVLPQAMYTTIWIHMDNIQLDNYLKLRLDKSAQQEIRWTAEAMLELTNLKNLGCLSEIKE